MTTKKVTPNKTKPRKMDHRLISSEPWEILYVRKIFTYVADFTHGGEKEITHPSTELIKRFIKARNNSRRKVYADLRAAGYTKIRVN